MILEGSNMDLFLLELGPLVLGEMFVLLIKRKIKFPLFGMFAPNTEHFAVWLVTC